MAPTPTMPGAPPRERLRVLIVDDSAVARSVMTRIVEGSTECVVAAAVPSVDDALRFLALHSVDVILLDLEMPGVDGLTGLPGLLAAGAGAKVLVVSSAAESGAAATIEALALGAADTLVKPGRSVAAGGFASTLLLKLSRLREAAHPVICSSRAPAVTGRSFDAVAIGASTGGIHALNALLQALPHSFHAPILVTQHLPAAFMPHFASQLAGATGRRCMVASDSLVLQDDMIVVAPGDAHLVAAPLPQGRVAVRLRVAPVPNGNVPSVDPMFESLSRCFGSRLLAIVLSGMGRDGLEGAIRVHEAGGTVLVQDRASSVVWGMPGAVAAAGIAHAVLPPAEIGALIAEQRVLAA